MITEKTLKIVTAIPGPESQKWAARKNNSLAAAASQYYGDILMQEGKGALLKDIDGNVYIDCGAGIGVLNVGHGDPDIIAAITEGVKDYNGPTFQVTPYKAIIELAEKLDEIAPGKTHKKVYFINSGSEANENNVKLARAYTGKTGIFSLENCFHGRSYMALALTSKTKPYKLGLGPFPADIQKLPSPYCYRCPFNSTYPECGLACAEKLAILLLSEFHKDSMAAVIAEPVQGEGGFLVPPKDYFKTLVDICHTNDLLFIADEVQSGFGRTGKAFAMEHFGVEPDLISSAKGLGGGMPLSASIGKDYIVDHAPAGTVGSTYGGNYLSCLSALEVVKKIQKGDILDNANKIGKIIRNRMNEMKEKYEIVGDVRGIGAMNAIELVTDKASKAPNAAVLPKIKRYCVEHGVIVLSAGALNNVIRTLPPLVMTEEQANTAMDVLDAACAEYNK